MTFPDPWVVDMRNKSGFTSRLGLPFLQTYKINKFTFFTVQIVLAVLLFLGLFLFDNWSPQQLTSGRATLFFRRNSIDSIFPSKRKKGLIIVTSHRAGSSFLGQFFNQRSDSFYVYEPLAPFGDHCQDKDTRKVEHLRNLFMCEFEDQISLFRRYNLSVTDSLGRNCWSNNFCFRHKMKSLCTKSLCRHGNPTTCRGCEPVDAQLASQKCKRSSIIVIKVIRMCSIEHLKPLMQDPDLDLKILHLVRDPRGIYSSRANLEVGNAMTSVAKTCNKTLEDWRSAVKGEDGWLEDKYKIVRYEDVCRHPLEVAHQIYQFVGLSMTPVMEQWIATNSEGSLLKLGDSRAYALFGKMMKQTKKRRKKLKNLLSVKNLLKEFSGFKKTVVIGGIGGWKEVIQNDPYTTTRNSSANWRKWALELDLNTVSIIQAICRDTLAKFDYVPVATDNELRNTSFPFVYNFCPNNSLTFSKLTCDSST